VQIEHIDAVKNMEEILSIPGIDAVLIGPYDLSASMGITGKLNHPEMINAMKKILETCKRNNVITGIHVVKPDVTEALSRIEEGYQLIAFSLDITIISEKSREFLDFIKSSN
jgi:2-dehydro-3-deoxyglucarate aldolase